MPEPTEQPFRSGFAGLVGIELQELTEGEARARVAVRDELKQLAGLVDGGVYATIAEDVCSAATWWALREQGRLVVGLSNHTSFLRPITDGSINAVARARHRGRTTWVWEVDFLDDRGRLCAVSRMTVAVREPDDGPRAQPR
ncbi:MAG: PaaI family thioesterase [Solirubrobacteraceae bacterium]|jgi:1,4-dihydroxy-2-naphthoyl-CoA hydrolase